MKTQTTPVKDLVKLLAMRETETRAATARTTAQKALEAVIASPLPLIDPVTLSRAAAMRQAWEAAKEAYARLPKLRRETAEHVAKTALDIGKKAAERMGGSYSGDTSSLATWGETAKAYTITDYGERYSRSCKYLKTDAMHIVRLDPARVHGLVESARLRELSARDGLPLIALDEDGACVWVRSSGKQIASQSGWIVGDEHVCFHSTKSREDAVKGHAKKRKMLDAEKAARELSEKINTPGTPEYIAAQKAERRARLVARLCGGITATIEDARSLGYCAPGIEAFQRQHGVGDTTTLPQLVKTGNQSAVALALKIARKVKAA